MSNEELDKYLVEAADQGELPFDPQNWSRFNKMLNVNARRKKARRVVFWLLGTASLLTLGIVTWKAWHTDSGLISGTKQHQKDVSVSASDRLQNIDQVLNDPFADSKQQDHSMVGNSGLKDNAAPLAQGLLDSGQAVVRRKDRSIVLQNSPAASKSEFRSRPAQPEYFTEPWLNKDNVQKEVPVAESRFNNVFNSSKTDPIEKQDHLQAGESDHFKISEDKLVSSGENKEPLEVTEHEAEKQFSEAKTVKKKQEENSYAGTPDPFSQPGMIPGDPPARYGSTNWKLIAYGGPLWNDQNLEIKNDQDNWLDLPGNEANIGWDLGMELEYKSRGFKLTSGINYFTIRRDIDLPGVSDTSINISDNSFWDVVDNGFWTVEDNSFWEYTDSALTAAGWEYTDSVYNVVWDSSYTMQLDSTYIVTIDTTEEVQEKGGGRTKNSIRTMSVPILVGYEFRMNRIHVGFQTGIGIDYIFGTLGQTVDVNGKVVELDKAYDLKQWNFSWLSGVSLDYRLSGQFFMGIQTAFRIPVTSYSRDRNVQLRYRTTSYRLRIGYGF